MIERLSKNKVESNPKLLCIVLDSLFSLNVTTAKIAKHTGLPENLIEGLAQGRAEGINEGIMLIAKNLKTMGRSVADIIKATGLSEDDIAKL